MPIFLLTSVASITFSMICYVTVFVLNRKTTEFTGRQMIVLMVGITADILGTGMMYSLSEGVKFDLHTISGYLALILMFSTGLTMAFALLTKNKAILVNFSSYYFPVLMVWILSYLTGIVVGLQKIS